MGKIGKTKAKSKPTGPEQQLKYSGPLDVPSASKTVVWWKVSLGTSFLLDAVTCLILFWSIHWSRFAPPSKNEFRWTLDYFLSILVDFKHDTFDLLLLLLLRIFLLLSLSAASSTFAFAEGWNMEITKGKGGQKDHHTHSKDPHSLSHSQFHSHSHSDPHSTPKKGFASSFLSFFKVNKEELALTTPLLADHHRAINGHDESQSRSVSHDDDDDEEEKHRVITPLKDESEHGFKEWFGGVSPKDVTIFFTFLLCTFFQVFVGAKCVSFFFPENSESIQGLLMGSAVVWINLQSYSISSLAESNGVMGRASALAALKRQRQEGQKHTGQGQEGPTLTITTSASGSIPSATSSRGGDTSAEDVLRGDRGVREEKVLSPRTYLMRAIALASSEMPLLCLGFMCLAVTSTAGLIIPKYQGRVLDDVIKMDDGQFKRDVLMMALFSLITGIFGGLRGLSFSIVGKRILKTLQDKLFSGVIIQDIAYFDATTSGELTSRLTNDVAAMSEPINWQLSALARNAVQLIGGIVLCFLTSWKLSMLAFTTMQPIMHITSVYSRWSRDLNRHRYAVLAEANSAAAEAFSNIRTVRACSTEDIERERYESKTRAAMLKGVRDAVAYSGAVAINNWLDLGASVLIFWYGGYLVMGGRLSIGDLIAYQLYWGLIQNAYQSIMSVLTSLTKASGAAQRVLSLVDALPDIDPNAGTMVSHLKGEVEFEGVHFHYQMRPDNPVLQGISISVKPGQVCALVGRSGGGKSTLVHLLLRYYDPTRGRVLLDGADLRSLNLKSVHKCMGLVAQDTQMWACSIEENIAYGLNSYTRAQVEEAAKFANAHSFILGFPEGYATRVGERGVRLSGGQRQRIAIARMLLRKPQLLVLDEATSALDTESEALVQQALDRLIGEGGKTIILVAHRLSTVRNADIIGVIDHGKIVEKGTHESLVKINNGVYEKLVRRQLSKSRNVIGVIQESSKDSSNNDRIDHLLETGDQ